MEQGKSSTKKTRSFLRNWLGFVFICIEFVLDFVRIQCIRYLKFFKKRPVTAIMVPVGLAFVAFVVVCVVAYLVIDYTMFHPKFCRTCHTLMNESYVTWEVSSHNQVNCHTCHPLTPAYIQSVGISLVKGVLRGFPDKIPARPAGHTIVRDQDCAQCHSPKGEGAHGGHGAEGAESVAASRFHAVHSFMGQVACMTCHGDSQLHVFTTTQADCLTCHAQQTDQVHAAHMADVTCLSCHTDQTADLHPNQAKCLACHGEEPPAPQLAAAGTIDVNYAPAKETVAQASKIQFAPGAAMQSLNCADCHVSHPSEPVSAVETCLSCHPQVTTQSEHVRHVQYYQGNCLACHQPHAWNLSEEWAQKECARCHTSSKDLRTFALR